jgi:hypothetical protein
MRLASFNGPARAVADLPVSGHRRLPISAVSALTLDKGDVRNDLNTLVTMGAEIVELEQSR